MTKLDNARRAAREFLKLMSGDASPEWQTKFLGIGVSAEPNAIGPVCTDQDHIDSEDPTAFECCPEPVIEVGLALATYLVELLNADRTAGAEGGEAV